MKFLFEQATQSRYQPLGMVFLVITLIFPYPFLKGIDKTTLPLFFEKSEPKAITPNYTTTVVKVNLTTATPSLCDKTNHGTVSLVNVSGLSAVRFEVGYDPNVMQVVDADSKQAGVQVSPTGIFSTSASFIVQNEVDNEKGWIYFAATLGENSFSGNSDLISINWQLQNTGRTGVILRNVTLATVDGLAISTITEDSLVEVSPVCDVVAGVVMLQGRKEHHGITVTDTIGQRTTTDSDGHFSFSGGVSIIANYPGYLSATAEVPPAIATNDVINLGQITLLAGDVKADNVINIFDLTYMAGRMNSQDSLADLNGDGIVNIFDLALAGGNYQRQGPLTDWQK